VKENWWETKGRETKIKMNINETKWREQSNETK
jgi:hypothetical protein